MNIKLHKRARTTPAVREEIATSQESARILALRYGVEHLHHLQMAKA